MSNAKKGQAKRFLITEHATGRPLVVVEAADDSEAIHRATAVVHLVGVKAGHHLWQISELEDGSPALVACFADGYFKQLQDNRRTSRTSH